MKNKQGLIHIFEAIVEIEGYIKHLVDEIYHYQS